jgi:hypothetical protein
VKRGRRRRGPIAGLPVITAILGGKPLLCGRGPDALPPAGLRNRAIAALGDAVIPQIPQAIGKTMMDVRMSWVKLENRASNRIDGVTIRVVANPKGKGLRLFLRIACHAATITRRAGVTPLRSGNW